MAVALVYQVALGWWMLELPKSPPGLRAGWFNVHKSIGMSIAALVLVRLAWRLSHPVPLPAVLPAWQRRAASASHALLYACMLLLPLTGYLGSAFSGYPVKLWGHTLPAWAAAWPAAKQFMSTAHFTLVCVFMAAIVVHVAAGLWHWLVARDGVAQRMGLPAVTGSRPLPGAHGEPA